MMILFKSTIWLAVYSTSDRVVVQAKKKKNKKKKQNKKKHGTYPLTGKW